MIDALRRHPVRTAVASAVIGMLLVGIVWTAVAMSSEGWRQPARAGATAGPTPSSQSSVSPVAIASTGNSTAVPVARACRQPTVRVSSAAALTAALGAARPGEVIALGAGSYKGNFVATSSGTASSPITLCGTAASILNGGTIKSGYVFHLDAANYWHLEGFSVTNGQKGVVADKATGALIQGLTVFGIGDEGIHLRDFSSNNTVDGNTISNTGMLKAKYGEGIYVGTAKSNWCSYSQCKIDASDHNTVSNNHISDTTAENVDIKEGTTGGILKGNTFDGVGMTAADSWVDVKGNDWTIEDNVGRDSPNDGFQTHQILSGWGTDNVFEDNTADVDGPGFGFHITKPLGNIVRCNNTVAGARQGLSNLTCSQ
ncbi:MAG TPA: right-handed parallel beta-helix repeat-containing protein [Galbitalea sp.]|jgi:parallel beta-helix repeat protein|nr:right-handed parallel beta-helix repeat-containing protein [Galbitalea sp.]